MKQSDTEPIIILKIFRYNVIRAELTLKFESITGIYLLNG